MAQDQGSAWESLPPLPDSSEVEELPPLPDFSEGGVLPPLPDVPENEELPPLPDSLEDEALPPLPDISKDEELPPLPDFSERGEEFQVGALPPVSGYMPHAVPQPITQQKKKPFFWMSVFAVAAIYSAVDVWQTSQATDQAVRDAEKNRAIIETAESNTEKAQMRRKQILDCFSRKKLQEDALRQLEKELDSIKREKEAMDREVALLREKQKVLQEEMEKIENDN